MVRATDTRARATGLRPTKVGKKQYGTWKPCELIVTPQFLLLINNIFLISINNFQFPYLSNHGCNACNFKVTKAPRLFLNEIAPTATLVQLLQQHLMDHLQAGAEAARVDRVDLTSSSSERCSRCAPPTHLIWAAVGIRQSRTHKMSVGPRNICICINIYIYIYYII